MVILAIVCTMEVMLLVLVFGVDVAASVVVALVANRV